MSAEIYGSVNGVTRKAKKLYANVNGVTREIKELWANVNGVTRKIYSSGARLQADPTLYYGNTSCGDNWEFLDDYCSVEVRSDRSIRFSMTCRINGSDDDYRVNSATGAVFIPINLGGIADFVKGKPYLKINTGITGYANQNLPYYVRPSASSYSIEHPEYMFLELCNSRKHAFTNSIISDAVQSKNTSNQYWHYPLTNGIASAVVNKAIQSQIIYVKLGFYMDSTHIEEPDQYTQFECTIPDNAFTIIDSSGNEYPVNFSF
jgi:hypothetical protein